MLKRLVVNEETARSLNFRPHRKLPIVIGAVRMGWPFQVATPEGLMQGDAGDYLLRGIKGELYPCKADVFEATYEVE